MGNGFQFKQFYIKQDSCAMKVSETACVFGAFIPLNGREASILDVGTGTGLLACMMAQRTNASITAIDLDQAAVAEARHNCRESPFSSRITVCQGDFLAWEPQKQFDLVICNPPFFEDQLPSENTQKRMAWHSSHLNLRSLLFKAKNCITSDGCIALLLPMQRVEEAFSYAQQLHLSPYFLYTLQHGEDHAIKYGFIGLTAKSYLPCHHRRLVLREISKQYTPTVFKRLQPFYASL